MDLRESDWTSANPAGAPGQAAARTTGAADAAAASAATAAAPATPATTATAAAAAAPCNLHAAADILLVEEMEGREAHIGDFFLAEGERLGR